MFLFLFKKKIKYTYFFIKWCLEIPYKINVCNSYWTNIKVIIAPLQFKLYKNNILRLLLLKWVNFRSFLFFFLLSLFSSRYKVPLPVVTQGFHTFFDLANTTAEYFVVCSVSSDHHTFWQRFEALGTVEDGSICLFCIY